MNQIRSFIATIVLVSHTISFPLNAETSVTPDSLIAGEETAFNLETLQFTLQHTFNQNEPLPKDTISIPLEKLSLLLNVIRENYSQHLVNQQRPVQIHSQLGFVLPQFLKETIGELPNLLISTNIQKDGSGNSTVTWPAEKREITQFDGSDKILLDWKGMIAQFAFTDQFKEITSSVQWSGLELTNQKGRISIGKSELTSQFDLNWIPSQLKFKLPEMEVVAPKEGVLKFSTLNFDLDTRKTENGLELNNSLFKIAKIQFTDEDGLPFLVKNIAFSSDSQLQGEVVNSTINSNIAQITLPKEFAEETQAVEMSYLANFALRNLDADALLALQKTARELQTQTNDPMMAKMALFGQFMAVIPKLLARSPEIALTQLVITTPKGNLEGKANLLLDGKKVTAFFTRKAWINALQAQLNLNISKNLLAKLLAFEEENEQAVTQKIQSLLEEKLLVKKEEGKEEGYKVVVEFQDSKLTINGQEVLLSDMFGSCGSPLQEL